MRESGGDNVFTTMRTKYHLLSPVQKKIADFILAHCSEVILSAIGDLAAECGTSETTIMRFLRKIGFRSYQVFKVKMAQDITAGQARSMIEDVINQALKPMIIHEKKHTERTIVEFVHSDVAGKISQGLVKVFAADVGLGFFPPSPRPSSELWPKEQKPDGRAINAMMPVGMAIRLPPPAARRRLPRDAYSGSWARPDRPCRH